MAIITRTVVSVMFISFVGLRSNHCRKLCRKRLQKLAHGASESFGGSALLRQAEGSPTLGCRRRFNPRQDWVFLVAPGASHDVAPGASHDKAHHFARGRDD